ncbi:hypothetical protein C8J57DRAFT_1588575 [Mycena rebaudengoi]|nr:hypothetical protein C8J57DRAFT_1588575 [Mycena rebaudengoi]
MSARESDGAMRRQGHDDRRRAWTVRRCGGACWLAEWSVLVRPRVAIVRAVRRNRSYGRRDWGAAFVRPRVATVLPLPKQRSIGAVLAHASSMRHKEGFVMRRRGGDWGGLRRCACIYGCVAGAAEAACLADATRRCVLVLVLEMWGARTARGCAEMQTRHAVFWWMRSRWGGGCLLRPALLPSLIYLSPSYPKSRACCPAPTAHVRSLYCAPPPIFSVRVHPPSHLPSAPSPSPSPATSSPRTLPHLAPHLPTLSALSLLPPFASQHTPAPSPFSRSPSCSSTSPPPQTRPLRGLRASYQHRACLIGLHDAFGCLSPSGVGRAPCIRGRGAFCDVCTTMRVQRDVGAGAPGLPFLPR